MADVAKQCEFLLAGYRHPDTDQPLESGEVFTYLDGTSTQSAFWVDRDKSSRASNPITLDSQGRAEVYGDNVYKFEIYEQRQDDGTIGAHVETINGIDLFTGESLTGEWITQTENISYASATSIEVTGDVTDDYHAGRRIKINGTATGTVYGTISSSSYSGATNKTTVNISWDSGGLSNESLNVSLGLLGATNPSLPKTTTFYPLKINNLSDLDDIPTARTNLDVAQKLPSGTKMLFKQSSAPSGWTFVSEDNDRVLLNTSTEAEGGNTGGGWTISGLSVDGHALSESELPSISGQFQIRKVSTQGPSLIEAASGKMSVNYDNGIATNDLTCALGDPGYNADIVSMSFGGDASHNHGLTADGNWRPSYSKVITCTKD